MTENPEIVPQPNQEPVTDAVTAPETQTPAEAPVVTESEVWDALRLVFDPEVPINIVDMGLVYDVRVEGKKVGSLLQGMLMRGKSRFASRLMIAK